MMKCEDINDKLSGYLDNELTQADQQKIDIHVRNCPMCSKHLDELREVREAVAQSHSGPVLEDEQWDKIMQDLPAKTTAGIGWLFFIAGALALSGLGLWRYFGDDSISIWVRLSAAVLGFGLILLFLSVLRQRLVALPNDKYRNVKY